MSIRYLPRELLKKIAPDKKIEKLISRKLTPQRAALSFLNDADFLDKTSVARVALKTIRQYKEKYTELKDEGLDTADAVEESVNDKKLLVDRVQNNIVSQISAEISDQYSGEYYKWLPSSSEVPDPLHQLNYGKRFQIGKGEMPGERYGCKCGMFILVKETKLKL